MHYSNTVPFNAPILLYTGISISHNGSKPFKFEAMWTLVLTAIIFVSKIKEVKTPLGTFKISPNKLKESKKKKKKN